MTLTLNFLCACTWTTKHYGRKSCKIYCFHYKFMSLILKCTLTLSFKSITVLHWFLKSTFQSFSIFFKPPIFFSSFIFTVIILVQAPSSPLELLLLSFFLKREFWGNSFRFTIKLSRVERVSITPCLTHAHSLPHYSTSWTRMVHLL